MYVPCLPARLRDDCRSLCSCKDAGLVLNTDYDRDNAIDGFGFLARASVLPAWLAWDSFGDGNGAATLAALKAAHISPLSQSGDHVVTHSAESSTRRCA